MNVDRNWHIRLQWTKIALNIGLRSAGKYNQTSYHIGHYFVGDLSYADDLIVLSPTVYCLEVMIIICENYAKKHSTGW